MAWSGLSDRRDKEPQPPRSWGYSGHGVQSLRPHHRHNEPHKEKDSKSPKGDRSPKHQHKKDHKKSSSKSPLASPQQQQGAETAFLLFPHSPSFTGKDGGGGGGSTSPKTASSPVASFFSRSPKSSPRGSPKSPEKILCWVSLKRSSKF